MKLALSSMISDIDAFMVNERGVPIETLVDKSGEAVAACVRAHAPKNKPVLILAGSGNNGADGYSCAIKLMDEYDVTVYDVFGKGQKTRWGSELYDDFQKRGGKLQSYTPCEETKQFIKHAGCIVDAVFGTGFVGDMPTVIGELSVAIRESVESYKIAVDVPLGINADNGSVTDCAISVDCTVVLSFVKPGIISYPAKFYVGEIVYDSLGINEPSVCDNFYFRYRMIDEAWTERNLPKRQSNSNKGTFGKLLVITGSEKYRGAAHLSVEAALRGGVGLVTYVGPHSLCNELSQKFPEVIFKPISPFSDLTDSELDELSALSSSHSATLIGSGSDNTDGLLKVTKALLDREGTPIILDADAINALSTLCDDGVECIKNAKREVILTPHPLEFARLAEMDVSVVQLNRLGVAESFALENKCVLVLKGAGTIVTNGDDVYINAVASSSLAKAGSGDVLAGFLAALLAQRNTSTVRACSLAVYFHSVAGVSLADEFSSYGVTPSDLPREIARQISLVEKKK